MATTICTDYKYTPSPIPANYVGLVGVYNKFVPLALGDNSFELTDAPYQGVVDQFFLNGVLYDSTNYTLAGKIVTWTNTSLHSMDTSDTVLIYFKKLI